MGNEVTIIVRARETASRTFSRVAQSVKDLGPVMARTLAKAASYGTAVGAVFTGPVVTGVLDAAKAVVALSKASAQLAPLAAFLPSLAASAGLLKATLTLAGPGMLKAIEPLTKEFANTEGEIGGVTEAVQDAASRGLPDLAKAFVKVNLPTVRKGMVGIAESVNRATIETGKWINSLEGQRLIKTVTEATDRAAERLAPKLSKAAIALGRLADRAGDRAITGLGNLLGRAADKAAEFMDNVSKADIEAALNKARDAGEGLWGKLVKVKDVIAWLGEHQDMLTGISDTLAATSIAIGAASGNWVAVIAGAATLILNHFDSIKSGSSSAWAAMASDPGVQQVQDAILRIARTIKEDFQGAMESMRPYIEQFGQALSDAWDKAAPLVVQFLENPDVVAGIKSIVIGLAAFVTGLALLAAGAAAAVAALTGLAAWVTGGFVTGILAVVEIVTRAFGVMMEAIGNSASGLPGQAGEIGRQMAGVGRDAQAAAGKVEGLRVKLGQLQSKAVTITFGAKFNPGSGDIFRAAGAGSGLGVLKKTTGTAGVGSGLGVLKKTTGTAGVGSGLGVLKKTTGVTAGAATGATGVVTGGTTASQKSEPAGLSSDSLARLAAQGRGLMSVLATGLREAVAGSTPGVTAAMDKLMAAVKGSGERGAQNLVKSFREQFLELAKKRESILAPLRQVVTEARKSYVDLVESTRSSLISGSGIGGGESFSKIVGDLSSKISTSRELTEVLAQLRKAGLDSTSIQQLVQSGPEMGLASARSILASGGAGVRQIADLQKQLYSAGTGLGTQAAESKYRNEIIKAEMSLKIESGGSATDEFILQILRKAVRAKGGNVQAVLGKAVR